MIVYEKRTCTTCRNLAALLEEEGIEFDRVDFHVEPLTADELRALVAKTGGPARDLFRAREPVYKELGLGDREPDDDEAIALMAEHPGAAPAAGGRAGRTGPCWPARSSGCASCCEPARRSAAR